MIKNTYKLLSLLCLVLMSANSTAHHSWDAVYGNGDEVKVIATVVGNVIPQPHFAVEVEIDSQQDGTERWMLEWRSQRDRSQPDDIAALMRMGESYEVFGRTAHLAGKLSIQVERVIRLSDGASAVENPAGGGRRR